MHLTHPLEKVLVLSTIFTISIYVPMLGKCTIFSESIRVFGSSHKLHLIVSNLISIVRAMFKHWRSHYPMACGTNSLITHLCVAWPMEHYQEKASSFTSNKITFIYSIMLVQLHWPLTSVGLLCKYTCTWPSTLTHTLYSTWHRHGRKKCEDRIAYPTWDADALEGKRQQRESSGK